MRRVKKQSTRFQKRIRQARIENNSKTPTCKLCHGETEYVMQIFNSRTKTYQSLYKCKHGTHQKLFQFSLHLPYNYILIVGHKDVQASTEIYFAEIKDIFKYMAQLLKIDSNFYFQLYNLNRNFESISTKPIKKQILEKLCPTHSI
jgi:hypothetical protein